MYDNASLCVCVCFQEGDKKDIKKSIKSEHHLNEMRIKNNKNP